MKPIILLTFGIFCSNFLFAQVQNVRSVVGVEYGASMFGDTHHGFERPTHTLGVHAEFPVNKFSFGTGLLYKKAKLNYNSYTDDTEIFLASSGEELTFYKYDETDFDLHFLAIPLRVQWRLPCNCAYLYAGMDINLLAGGAEEPKNITELSTTEEPSEFEIFEANNANYEMELGLGFKLHQTDRFRYFIRPSYNLIFNSIRDVGPLNYDGFKGVIRLSLGAQIISYK